jgi:hypothetical protein
MDRYVNAIRCGEHLTFQIVSKIQCSMTYSRQNNLDMAVISDNFDGCIY